MDVFLIQALLGISLFFVINWIGKHSYSIGYMQISLFVKVEEAPALNYLIRVLTPVVYIILFSTTFYHFGLDRFVSNIYLVNIYYIIFRLVFNLITGRGLLLNWYRQTLYWVSIIVLSYFTYDKIIKDKKNILPDFQNVSNELWIIILIFIFQLTNNIRLSQDGTIERKENYLKTRYFHFKNLYGTKITEITNNQMLEALAYAILIYEDFNRPKVVRFLENLKFKVTKKTHTLGVMQVSTNKILSDRESVELGTKKLVEAHIAFLSQPDYKSEYTSDHAVLYHLIGIYNTGSEYSSEVYELTWEILTRFYPNSSDTLAV